MSSEHAIAQALPEYDILGEVGAGAYGRVWRGRHRALDRAVAVKELLADATPAEAARFRGEARLLARIDYPHVVRVFDYRERVGVRLLVMELLTGGTLAERRAAGISVESAVGATIAAACGLQVVHEAGILHHDVKPENLLFDDQGTLKVADFGQARSDAIHATARDEPVLGALVGTPAYVSPEQAAWALGDPGSPVDARSDQYSLAATLFELVTGRLTHDATGGALALCERRAHQDPRSARSLRADLPREIEAVLERALAPRPDDRYPDCGALARALAAAAPTLGAGWFERSEVRVREPSLALGGAGPPTGSATPPDAGSGEMVVPLSARLRRHAEALFAGRSAEQEHWVETWKSVVAGDVQVWLIGGEAGVGKSALVSRLARKVHDDGGAVFYGRCVDDLGSPYQPWVDALTSIVTYAPRDVIAAHVEARGGELARLVPQLTAETGVEDPVTIDAEADRYALFGAVMDLLARTSARTPTVIVLEDLHWADQSTIQLLRHVVSSADRMPLAILATYRPTDLGVTHPLTAAFGPLRREPVVDFVDLGGLSDVELLELMEAIAGHPLDVDELALRDALVAETSGNAFFVLEILRHLSEIGALGGDDDGWTATPDLAVHGLPVSVRQVIGERVTRLGDDAARLLSAAAVIGREFDLGLLAEVASVDVDDALDQLDDAAAAGLVHNLGPDRYLFAHALVEHTLYEDLSPSRRARVHRRIAEALEARQIGTADDVVPQLAHHWTSALVPDDATRAIESACRAGEHAAGQLAPERAIHWFTKALQLDESYGSDERTVVRILVGLGDAQRQVNDSAHRATLLDAAARARALGAADLLVAAALANGRGWADATTGSVDHDVVEVVEHALDLVGPTDSVDRVLLLARLVVELTFDDDLHRRRGAAEEAEAMARRLGDDRALLAALVGLLTLPARHDTDHVRWADEAIDLATRLDDPVSLALAAGSGATTAVVFADRDRFDRAVEACGVAAARVVDPVLSWRSVGAHSLQAILDGELDRAEALVTEVLSDTVDVAFSLLWYGSMVMTIRGHQGHGAEIRDVIDAVAQGAYGSASELAKPARALADLQAGDEDSARRGFAEQARQRFVASDDTLWMTHVCINAHVCARLGERDHAVVLRELLEPSLDLVAAGPSVCLFSVASCAGMLSALLGHHDDADRLFALAIDRTTAFGAPYLVASAQLEWAHALSARPAPDPERAGALVTAALRVTQAHGYGEIERRGLALRAVLDDSS